MLYNNLTDNELWECFLSGDKKAFAYIYSKQYRHLYSYGSKLISDKELVKDCIQDMFVKLYLNRKNLNTAISINTYLICSLKNKLIDALKYGIDFQNIDQPGFDLCAEEELLQQFSINDEDLVQKKKLNIALSQLSGKQKEAIYLKYIRELSYEELSEILDTNIQSCKNLISRTLLRLRALCSTLEKEK